MFPVAVVLIVFGYTCVYVGLANGSNGGQGPSIWEALGWGETPEFDTGVIKNGRKLTPSANPQVDPSFTQI